MALRKHKGELYDLMGKHLPAHLNQFGELSTTKLSKGLKVSRQAIDIWFKNNQIPARKVYAITKLSHSKLKQEMLIPFVDFGAPATA